MICQGDSVKIGYGGGKGLTYSWNNGGFSPNQYVSKPASYILTVTNTLGCSNTDTMILLVTPKPTPIAGKDSLICYGDSIKIGYSGTFGSTYSWNNGNKNSNQIVNKSGKYYLTETNSKGCKATDSVTININNKISPKIQFRDHNFFVKAWGTVPANKYGKYTYEWKYPDSSSSKIADTVYRDRRGASYFVAKLKASDSLGCSGFDSVSVYLEGILSNTSTPILIKLYPNPTHDLITLELNNYSGNSANIQLLDIFGRLIYSKNKISSKEIINLEQLNIPSGNYLLKVSIEGQEKVLKVSKW